MRFNVKKVLQSVPKWGPHSALPEVSPSPSRSMVGLLGDVATRGRAVMQEAYSGSPTWELKGWTNLLPETVVVGQGQELETDGVRGVADVEALEIKEGFVTKATSYRMGIAGALYALASGKNVAHIARDQRSSGPVLMKWAELGARSLGVDVKIDGPQGVLSTPALSWAVHDDAKAGSGLVVTSSHNPENKNGIKLVDKEGEKAEKKWEDYATRLLKAENLEKEIEAIAKEEGLNLVKAMQREGERIEREEALERYVQKIFDGVNNLMRGKSLSDRVLVIDCANGSGSGAVKMLAEKLEGRVKVVAINTGDKDGDVINKNCGAEDLNKKRRLPQGIETEERDDSLTVIIQGQSYPADKIDFYTLDGDADRDLGAVFSQEGKDGFLRIDGDMLLTYKLTKIKELLDVMGIWDKLQVGAAQTVMANGGSAQKLRDAGLVDENLVETPVGDKYVSAAAHKLDIGLYAEAAGHESIHFSDKAKWAILKFIPKNKKELEAKRIMLAMMGLQNPVSGDGVQNIFLAKALTEISQEGLGDMLYGKYPSTLITLKVAHKEELKTDPLGKEIVSAPGDLKEKVAEIMTNLGDGYELILRKSGTSTSVRVFVKAVGEDASQREADRAALAIALLVYKNEGIQGVGGKITAEGELPQKFESQLSQ